MEQVKVQVTAQGNELILREGQAPKVFDEKGYGIKTTMRGVRDYFKKRNIAERISDSYLVCSYEENKVELVINDVKPELCIRVTGGFSDDEDVVALGINDSKRSYSFVELENALRFRAHLFPSVEEYYATTASLRKVKYSIVADVEKENDLQGNKKDLLFQKLEGALPKSMVYIS